MGPSRTEYRALLEQAFAPEVQQALLLAVGSGYHSALEHCKRHFEREDRHDALGAARRGKLHGEIRGVAKCFSLDSKDEPNSNGSTYFLSVFSGEFRLICCLVAAPDVMVRPCEDPKALGPVQFRTPRTPRIYAAFGATQWPPTSRGADPLPARQISGRTILYRYCYTESELHQLYRQNPVVLSFQQSCR